MNTSLGRCGSELEFLAGLLDQVARYAQAKIDAIPENVSVRKEMAAIEAVIKPADSIAEHMTSLPAKGKRDTEAKARAKAWLAGRYGSLATVVAA